MALVVKDRVKQFSTTSGTGTITLGATPTGFQSFSVLGNGNTTYYAIVDNNNGDWEVGLGTYTLSGTTLSRDTVLSSSNSGSLVNFSSDNKEVFVTYPAEQAVYGQADDTVQVNTRGTVTVPAYSFAVDPNTGMYSPGADVLAFSASGTNYLTIDGVQGALTISDVLRLPNGTASRPALINSGSLTTGIYFPTTTSIGLSTVNTVRLTVSTTAFTATLPWRGQNGTAAAPALSASADTNTGVYFPAADVVGITTGGVDRLLIEADGDIVNKGVFYYNARTIAANVTLSATENAMSIGPLVINDGVVVTVPDGGSWSVL